jgi:ankyrin repeat protein
MLNNQHLSIGLAIQGRSLFLNLFYNHFRAETATAYLLAWNCDVNSTDSNGLTPLHLAVKSSEEIKSSRSVRHLLIKGASRSIRDKLGRTPLDIARMYTNKEL